MAFPVTTIRKAINALVKDKRLALPAVVPIGAWSPDLQGAVILGLNTSKANMAAWQHALVVGKLVSTDGKSVKLPPLAAKFLSTAATALQKAQAGETQRYKDFTKVNAADTSAHRR